MNTFQSDHPLRPLSVWQHAAKKLSLGLVTMAAVVILSVARPDVTSADGCKTTTGQCSTSIGLWVS